MGGEGSVFVSGQSVGILGSLVVPRMVASFINKFLAIFDLVPGMFDY